MLQQQQHTEQLHKHQHTTQMHQHAPASQSSQEPHAVASAASDTSARQAVAPVSDMHKLVAQAAAAAALKRQSQHHSQQQQQHSPLLQQQLQSKSGLLLRQDAGTQADLPPASQVLPQLAVTTCALPNPTSVCMQLFLRCPSMNILMYCLHNTVDNVLRCHNKYGGNVPQRGFV